MHSGRAASDAGGEAAPARPEDLHFEEFADRTNAVIPTNPATLRVDIPRLNRARKLWCIPLGGGRYAVQGSREAQYIDMYGETVCYCEDHLLNGAICKHILRALMEERHPLVMAYIAQEQAMEDQRNRWAHGEE